MEQLKATLKAEGWSLHMHKRRRKQLKYAYAAKRIEGKVREVYIAPETDIPILTPERVRDILSTKK